MGSLENFFNLWVSLDHSKSSDDQFVFKII